MFGDNQQPARGGDFGRGLLTGLAPLASLVVIIALAVALTALIRNLTASQGFFAQQQVSVITLVIGLIAAATSYTIGCVRALRRVGAWQRMGETTTAAGTLWALGVTILIILAPLLLAAVLPQHPAP
jgi:hypothetical protein